MSCFEEFANWDPMADDYACPRFNSYDSNFGETNPLDYYSLYIKNIPVALSNEAFIALMSEDNRKIVRSRINPPRANEDHTSGFVSFQTPDMAKNVIKNFNGKLPLTLNIKYANKRKPGTADLNTHSTESTHPISVSSNSGIGRGNFIKSVKQRSLKVVLDGDRRSAFHSAKIVKDKECAEISNLPNLVPNPFLSCIVCGNVGTFSCDSCKKPYCSQECQTSDWSKHKIICRQGHKTSRDSSYVSESSSSDSDKKSEPSPSKPSTSIKSIKSGKTMPIKSVKSPEKPVKVDKVINAKEIIHAVLPPGKHTQVKVCHVESPSKFWVHLQSADSILPQMERDISLSNKSSLSDKIQSTCVGIVCCLAEDGRFKRVNILKVNSNKTSLVEFVDYGNTSVAQNEKLFYLPEIFKEVPYQAICCKLVDSCESKDILWTEDDTASLQMHASENKYYAAHVVRRTNDIFEVNLANEEGISLYSIICGLRDLDLSSIEVKKDSNSTSLKPTVPSVWSSLKNGSEVTIVGVEFAEDRFWGILDNGNAAQEVGELDTILQNLKTKQINMYVEEGDVVAGFSKNYQQYFRCTVLQRKRDSFLVHFIDYGNKEEVSDLCELTPDLLNRCCYIVCCTKPDCFSAEDFKEFFKNVMKVSVKKIDNSTINLSFTYKENVTFLNCYPWHHGIVSVKQEGAATKKSPSRPNISAPIVAAKENVSKSKITSDLITDLQVKLGIKYSVRVSVFDNVAKTFVHFRENEQKLTEFIQKLNKHCSCTKLQDYFPIKDEIVCCKFREDGLWYRVQVIGKKKEIYKVFFIDYGNEDFVSAKEMKPLPEEFSIPKFCACVSLYNVKNEDLNKELLVKITNEYIDMEVVNLSTEPAQVILSENGESLIDCIRRKAGRSKSLLDFKKLPMGKTQVAICHGEDEKIYIQKITDIKRIEELCEKMNSEAVKMPSVRKVEVNNIYCALFTDGLWYRASVDKELSPNMYQVSFIDFGNKENVNTKDLKELPEEFFNFPVLCHLAIPQNLKICQLQHNVPYEIEAIGEESGCVLTNFLNVQSNTQPVEPEQTTVISSLLLTDLPTEITVTYQEGDVFYVQRFSDIEPLSQMMADLQSLEVLKHVPRVNEIVSVKYTDNLWYRGLIKSDSGNNFFQTFFVDFGNTDNISVENICRLPSSYASLPMYCIPIKLNSDALKTKLTIDEKYVVKRVGNSSDNIQIVKVRPKVDAVLLTAMQASLLEDNITSVFLQSSDGKFHFVIKCSDDIKNSNLSKLLSNFKGEEVFETPSVGQVFIVKANDDKWYRGCIRTVNEVPGHCKVFLFDLGLTESISISNIFYASEELLSYPVLTIKVLFSSDSSAQTLSLGEKLNLSIMSVNNNIPTVKIHTTYMISSLKKQYLPIQIPKTVISYHIDGDVIFLQDIDHELQFKELLAEVQTCALSSSISHKATVGELLVAQSSSDGIWYRCCVEEILSPNKYRVNFIDFGNCEEVSKENLKNFTRNLAKQPPYSIPVKLVDVGSKMELDNIYTVLAENHPVNNEPQLIRLESSLESSKIPTAVEEEAIIQTSNSKKYYYNDCEFVPFPPGKQSIILNKLYDEESAFCAPYSTENLQATFQLTSEITEYCNSSNALSYNESDPPVLNEMVLAKFEGEWYRAAILNDQSKSLYEVLFVDFGNTEDLSLQNIRKIEERFMHLNIQSHMCCLSGGFKFKEGIADSAKSALEMQFSFKPLDGEVKYVDTEIHVTLPEVIEYLGQKGLITFTNT